MENNSKQVVAHFVSNYLFLTGSWIHSQLVHMEKYKAIVLSYDQKTNLDMYPFDPIYCYSDLSLLQKIWLRAKGRYFKGIFEEYCYQVLKKHNVKLVHCHFGDSAIDFLELRRRLGFSLAVSFYGADMSLLPQDPAWRERYQPLFDEGALFLVEGPHMKKELINLGCAEERVIVQHLGVNLEEHPFLPRKIGNDGQIRILIAGTFREKKGIPYALQAFAKIAKQHNNVHITLLGDSAGLERDEREKKKILQIISDHQLDEHIDLLGFRPFEEFKQILLGHHIFLSPSVTAEDGDSEGGAPVSITEASATGMPVIATTHADIPEVIVNNEGGLLCAERDVDALAKNLDYIISNPDTWEVMGEKGRARIEKEFNCKTQVAKLEKLYESVINQCDFNLD